MKSTCHGLQVSHDTRTISPALEASVVSASPAGGVHHHRDEAENENHHVVGHDGVSGRDAVSDCNCYCVGRNSGHHCGMI